MISNDDENKILDILFVLISNYHPKFCVPFFLAVIYFLLLTRILCIGARRCLVLYGIVC